MINNKRNRIIIYFLHAFLILITILYFWTQSRYPALDNKMFMGTRNILTGISFDNIWDVSDSASYIERMAAGTVNWYYTNWKGMTFGLIFSVLTLSLFSFIQIPNIKQRWLRAMLGAFVGAPLGVCANCATPITQGFKASGLKDETALAITLSSPTLNIIVLTILFQNFSTQLIALKLITTISMIVLVIPLISHFFIKKNDAETSGSCIFNLESSVGDSIYSVLWVFLKSISQSLWYILKTTLPFMLLAGLLGTIIFDLIGIEMFVEHSFSWWKLFVISLAGTLLPVPMTFDVVFTQKLLGSDTNISYVVALLCTLGIFSVYPFMMFWKNFSRKIAISIFVSVWFFGFLSGAIIHFTDTHFLAHLPIEEYKRDPKAFIIDKVNNYCKEKGTKFEKCQKHYLTLNAVRLGDESVCNQISDVGNSNACKFSVQIKKLNFDYEKCNTFPDFNECFSKMVSRITKQKISKVLPCEKQGKKDDLLCKDMIRLFKNTSHSEPFNCFYIENSQIKDKCFTMLTFSTAKYNKTISTNETRFSEKCSLVEDENVKDLCFVKLAQITKNSRWCSRITDNKKRLLNECQTKAIVGTINEKTSRNVCKSVKDSSLKELCFEEFDDYEFITELKFLNKISSISKIEEEDDDIDFEKTSDDLFNLEVKPIVYNQLDINKNYSLFYADFNTKNSGKLPFTRINGNDLGINYKIFFDDVESFSRGYGMAAGDLNNDGLDDIAIGSYQELNLFFNDGSKFIKLPIKNVKDLLFKKYQLYISPVNIAFVDIDNDSDLDIFISNYDGNLFFILNDNNLFKNPNFVLLPRGVREWGISAGFADFNRDGLLDIFIGNGQGAIIDNLFTLKTSSVRNSNEIFINNMGNKFTHEILNDNHGVSLVTLASDFNNDGFVDIVSGNDFEVSDMFYLGSQDGKLNLSSPSEKLFNSVTYSTMSYDTADIDNDLKLEMYSVGMKRGFFYSTNYCNQFDNPLMENCESLFNDTNHIKNLEFNVCNNIKDFQLKTSCYSKGFMVLAARFNDKNLCSLIPKNNPVTRYMCENKFIQREYSSVDKNLQFKQKNENHLYKQNIDGTFKDIAGQYEVTNTHWGWNTKFADLDNDSWVDIYAANGRFKLAEIATNIFFHNLQGKKYSNKTKEFNLEDYVDTSSFVYVDYDRDGDLDIFSQGYLSPVRVFSNNNKNNSIEIRLVDYKGNRFGVGAKVFVTYVENNKEFTIMKELKASGGFASYDPLMLHFGLNRATKVSKVEVKWTTGLSTIIQKDLAVNREYKIYRN